jgi:RNA polymerase sigma factor (sigma-70 family)
MAAEAFALRYFEEFSNQEIAEILGSSPNSIAVILHRARDRLRGDLRAATGAEDE